MGAKGEIYGINGPVVEVVGEGSFSMLERVSIGTLGLIGEVIGLQPDKTIVQAYESTTGVMPGEPVTGSGSPMLAALGPGIIGNIFDGIQRPLRTLAQKDGAYIGRGVAAEPLDTEKVYEVEVLAKAGARAETGQIIAQTPETPLIMHKVMVPPGVSGTVTFAAGSGTYTIDDVLARVTDESGQEHEIRMVQMWPIRRPRPHKERRPTTVPLITGQRVIDSLLPIAKGGAAAVPGGFGTGKTMTQHQLAKWADADIIVYIGCGERGNEMTQVLEDFSKLVDPKSGRPLLDRTVLIANTSNMPVAAREASIYTGVTLAEYYRDMGYHVAIMADSTSRWAEALREISGRLEEMPAEEGFPAYLSSRLSEFYERAGRCVNLNGTEGSVTIIGAVSPQGGDFSEPVTQNTKRFVRSFWALDRSLAYARHYPAINWINSYSEYIDDLAPWYNENLGESFLQNRSEIMAILQEEANLNEIVKLIGADVLPDGQKLTLEIARVIRLGFLQQNAFHADDTYVPLAKQARMMETILYLYGQAKGVVAKGIPVSQAVATGLFEDLIKMKYTIGNDDLAPFDALHDKIRDKIGAVLRENGYEPQGAGGNGA